MLSPDLTCSQLVDYERSKFSEIGQGSVRQDRGSVDDVDGYAVLPARESRAVLRRVILPAAAASAVPQARPVVVFVGGQPRTGKTNTADLVSAALRRRGGSVRIGRDLYKAAHRHYAAALAADVRTAGAKVRPDTSSRQAAVEEYVRDHGLDAVVESALADPDDFRGSSESTVAPGTESRSPRSRRRRS
nr:zeta toxin family protein [Streptomyces sp. SID5606]